jgi:hypothetical protein
MDKNRFSKHSQAPAFPCQPLGSDGVPETQAHFGLNKREYMATEIAVALTGLVPACPNVTYNEAIHIAKQACMIADALIIELRQPSNAEGIDP